MNLPKLRYLPCVAVCGLLSLVAELALERDLYIHLLAISSAVGGHTHVCVVNAIDCPDLLRVMSIWENG